MSRKNISQEKIIQAFIKSAFEKSAGATSLADISEILEIKKASLYNHFENRDAMYDATLEYCAKQIAGVSFLPSKTLDAIKNNKISPSTQFKKLITRYFDFYENEPFFEIYTLVHTEQYFRLEALKIIEKETENIINSIYKILREFSLAGKLPEKTDKELKDASSIITAIIIQQRDFYIIKKKETVRQNPESGAGSLFALPTDETSLSKTVKLVDSFLKIL